MLISYKWLNRHVDLTGVNIDELANRITLNVAELEGVHAVGAEAAQCVVGYVNEVVHVEGTHLHLCQVDTGEHGKRQIICGAPNIAAEMSVPVVLPGMTIGDLTIAERKVRLDHVSKTCLSRVARDRAADGFEVAGGHVHHPVDGIPVVAGALYRRPARDAAGDLFRIEVEFD